MAGPTSRSKFSFFSPLPVTLTPDGRTLRAMPRAAPPARGLLNIGARGPMADGYRLPDPNEAFRQAVQDSNWMEESRFRGGGKAFGKPQPRNRPTSVAIPDSRNSIPPQVVSTNPPLSRLDNKREMREGTIVRPYLSEIHSDIIHQSKSVSPEKKPDEWDLKDFAQWQLLGQDLFRFKDQWVRGYKDAINAAAARFDIPPVLLAGVVYNEVGGDPPIFDNVAYTIRGAFPSATRDRDLTSFGNASIQVRRAAEALGYENSNNLTASQRRSLIDSLEDPVASIFIAAKHLSDLRDFQFKGVHGNQLSRRHIEILGARYNHGPEIPLELLIKNTRYGKDISKRLDHLENLLGYR